MIRRNILKGLGVALFPIETFAQGKKDCNFETRESDVGDFHFRPFTLYAGIPGEDKIDRHGHNSGHLWMPDGSSTAKAQVTIWTYTEEELAERDAIIDADKFEPYKWWPGHGTVQPVQILSAPDVLWIPADVDHEIVAVGLPGTKLYMRCIFVKSNREDAYADRAGKIRR